MTPRRRVLVIGAGSIGARHVRCFQQTGRAEVVLCEVNPLVREQVATQYALAESFADLESAVAAGAEAAVICTPAPLHVPMAARLADAGVHLLIEKPLSTSTDGVDALVARCRDRKLVAGVAYVYRVHPVLAAMRRGFCDGGFW